MRLQVFLSHNGVTSRRKAMDLIFDGQVTVNGKVVTEPSTFIEVAVDRVVVSGKLIETKKYDYVLLNKPNGFDTTRDDPHAKRIVYDLLPKHLLHVMPVGRLDRDTEGLLLLTNDGDLAYQLTHPKFNVDKTYFVRVLGRLEEKSRRDLEKGMYLDRRKTAPAKLANISFTKNETHFFLTIHEGQKRQIRRMMMKLGNKVVFLQRIAQGSLRLGKLGIGKWRMLSEQEIATLKSKDFSEGIRKQKIIAPRIMEEMNHQKIKNTLKKALPK